jgi:putative endonuclease
MGLVGRGVFAVVRWRARKGLSDEPGRAGGRATGVRGETYAYWFLRRHGYVLVARNYQAPGLKGEIDLVGYDGEQLAFVEVKTRSGEGAQPEDAITPEKRRVLGRMARAFLAERRLEGATWRFDVVAIRSRAGSRPEIRLHKAAFGAE